MFLPVATAATRGQGLRQIALELLLSASVLLARLLFADVSTGPPSDRGRFAAKSLRDGMLYYFDSLGHFKCELVVDDYHLGDGCFVAQGIELRPLHFGNPGIAKIPPHSLSDTVVFHMDDG